MEIKMKSALMALVVLSCVFSVVEAQSNPHYMSTDPAIRQMKISMNMPSTPMVTDPAIIEMLISMNMPQYAGNAPTETIAGNWQLNLSDGSQINLTLQQSGSALFGKGNITADSVSQGAYAAGSISGNGMRLEVVPESGRGLYVISVDISSAPFVGNYVAFIAGSEAQSGTLKASKNPTNG
jgi:hypothetical protein